MPPISVPSLIGGVSRQPAHIRSPDQVQDAENVMFSVDKGAEKRPGTRLVSRLEGVTIGAVTAGRGVSVPTLGEFDVQWIDRDGTEKYCVLLQHDNTDPIQVFGLFNGAKFPVSYKTPEAQAYCVGPRRTIRLLSLTDTTLILNTQKVVGTLAASAAPNYDEGDPLFAFTKHESPKIFPKAPTNHTWFFADNDYPYESNRPQLQLELLRGYYFAESTATQYDYRFPGDASDSPFKYERRFVATADLLPTRYGSSAYSGAPVDLADPVYYEVKRSSVYGPLGWRKGVGAGDKTWSRFPTPNTPDCYLDPDTLPVKMTRRVAAAMDPYGHAEGTVYFEVEANAWTPRYTGDNTLNPLPKFVGKAIADMIVFRNRLFFASGEWLVGSSTGDYFSFFIDDYTQLIESDRIQVSTSSAQVTPIDYLQVLSGALVVFSQNGFQHELRSSDQPLSPLTATLVPTTKYNTAKNARPVRGGNQLYFATEEASPTSIREYYFSFATNEPQSFAYDITAHVKGYIPKGVAELDVSDKNGTLFVRTDADETSLFVYRYFWAGEEKAQSAWGRYRYTSRDRVLGMRVIDDDLYMLLGTDYVTGAWTQSAPMTGASDMVQFVIVRQPLRPPAGVGEIEAYFPHLDWAVELDLDSPAAGYSATYIPALNGTLITLPWFHPAVADKEAQLACFVVSGDHKGQTLKSISHTVSTTGNTTAFFIQGEVTGQAVVGLLYDKELTLSRPFFRDQRGSSVVGGATNITSVTIMHADTGFFRFAINNTFRGSDVWTFDSKVFGTPGSALGLAFIGGPGVTVTAFSDPDHDTYVLSNESALPSAFTAIVYDAEFTEV